MNTLHRVVPDDLMLEHACRGLPVHSSNPIVLAAAHLGELHAARLTEPGRRDIGLPRLRLARRIDVLIAAAAPLPRPGARMHTETVGVVVDRIASRCAIAFHAPSSRVSSSEIDDAQAQLRQLRADYVELIDEIAAGICCLPTTHLPQDTPSGIQLLMRRQR